MLQDLDLIGRSFVIQAKENNTAMFSTFAKDHLAEIFVVGY